MELKNSLQVESLQVRGKGGEGKRGKAVDDEGTGGLRKASDRPIFRTYPVGAWVYLIKSNVLLALKSLARHCKNLASGLHF